MAFKPIQIVINAKDNASGVFDKLSGKIKAAGALILGYFGIKSFVGAVQGAADLEAAISRVAAAADGGADELKALRAAAEQAGSSTQFTATEAAGALENLVKAGLSANDAIGALPATLALAAAGDVELASAAEILTKSMAGMGLQIEDTARIADVLAKGANASNSSVDGLAQAFSFVAPIAQSTNLSLEQTVAVLGKMADAGIDASRAGTALSGILTQFSDPASKFRNELAAIGITTTDFDQALHQLADAGDKGSKAILSVGRNAGPALRALLNQGMPALDALKTALDDAEGSAAATAATMQDNLRGAMRGLGSAWETVKNALFTPVLPALKDGVDKLAGSLREMVSGGAIERFGAALASTFEASIAWVEKFIAAFNWDAATANMTSFADQVSQTMDQLAQKAAKSAALMQTAWGVMTGGVNAVLTGIYLVGGAMSDLVAQVQQGAAWISDAFAKVTFGGLSARFAAAADEIRLSAEATSSVADAFGAKARQAFIDMADGAQMARDGWHALGEGAAQSAGRVGEGFRQAADSVAAVGAAAVESSKKVVQAVTGQTDAVKAAREKVGELRAEYAEAIDAGNVQRAAEIMIELARTTDTATGATRDLKREAADAAAQVEAAFARSGVQTKTQLADLAAAALRDYELIKSSGEATADGLSAAWKRAADAAIAAGDGVVPAWVQAGASARGYAVEVEAGGQVVLRTLVETSGAVESLGGTFARTGQHGFDAGRRAAAGWDEAAAAAGRAMAEARKYDEYMASRFEQGWARNEDGRVVRAAEDPALRNQRLAARYGEDMIGNKNAEAAYGLAKRIELLERYSFGPGDGSLALLKQELERLTRAMEADRAGAASTGPSGGAPRGAAPGRGVTVALHYGGRLVGDVNTDLSGQRTMEEFLRTLERARGVAR
jgi:TP901 family phage tail tape measure protein